jgi:hypothetical protein
VRAALPGMNARELSNTWWGLAAMHADVSGARRALVPLAEETASRLAAAPPAGAFNAFNARDLSNVAWAAAKVGWRDGALLAPLTAALAPAAPAADPQSVANGLWALTSFRPPFYAAACVAALACRAAAVAGGMSPQEQANAAWAAAEPRHDGAALADALAAATAPRLARVSPAESAMLAHALAQLRAAAPPLLAAQQAANFAWAAAVWGIAHAGALSTLDAAAGARRAGLEPPHLPALAFPAAFPLAAST